jgi:hypothetical protein
MNAKQMTIIAGCLLICVLLAGATFLPWLRIQYHLRALRQMQKEKPVFQSMQDCDRQCQALIKLGYMEHIEMSFQHRVLTGAVWQTFVSEARQRMPTNDIYWSAEVKTGEKLSVTCPKMDTAKWQKLVSDFDKP